MCTSTGPAPRGRGTAVDAAIPGASESEQRAAIAKQLHRDLTARAWAQVHEWDQVRARQAAAAQARAEAAAAQPVAEVPAAPVAPIVLPAPRPAAVTPAPEVADVNDDQELVVSEPPSKVAPPKMSGLSAARDE
ncbi:hypothetical protein [Streptomyces griseorubiginosus]|uniref:hypothetical protein n=1 Tax=Streptomyces griseorubiginosus TaxID=67304 RepID=UPI003664DD1D